jgi:RNA-directed DNA polymerase
MGFFRDLVQRLLGEAPAGQRPASPPAGPRAPEPAPPPTPVPTPLGPEFVFQSTTDRVNPAGEADVPPDPATNPGVRVMPPGGTAPAPTPPTEEPPRRLGLDAGDFLPITRDEMKAAVASGPRLLGGLWFGRRDRIPPLDDERTRLIDRALVTHGLLTPEQLVEIHRVGDAMDRARPAEEAVQHRAAVAGEAAVQADRAERARIKAVRQAESAERKRLRAEEVAHRKATDIVYLGRGVSKFLGDRSSDLAALEAAGLPALGTPAELAEAMGLTVSRLRWLAFHAEAATRVHYVDFEVPKKAGGTRRLSAPHRSMASAQRWVFGRIVALLPAEPEAHGFLPGRSILSNASAHAGKAVVVNLDLEGFFPGIGYPRVRSVFRRAGYSPASATILGLLCTECPRRQVVYDGTTYHVATGPRGLPQGACTSPGLSNQVARRLDRRLAGLAARLGATYTRYADDLTFSGDEALNPKVGYLMARVRHLAGAEGFVVNESKTRVLRRNVAQVVTGLVVNDRPGVPRAEVRRLRALLHRARLEGLDAQNRDGHPDFRAWLRGKIAYVGMARPEVGGRLLADFEALTSGS